jgi:hypothetical protein
MDGGGNMTKGDARPAAVMLGLLLAATTSPSSAQDLGDVASGHKLAETWSLRAFLQTPHARMPDLHLTREEVDDLASYILSLRAG